MWTTQLQMNNDLLNASMAGILDEVRSLLANGAYIDYKDDHGYSPLFLAVIYQRGEVVRLLLSAGANPDVCNYRSETPLMFARTPDLIKILAEYKANSLIRNQDGLTGYELLFINKKTELIKAWIAARLQCPRIMVKVKLDKDDLRSIKRCMTGMRKIEKQLFTAVGVGDIDRIQCLVKEKDVNVNIANPQGITTLMLGAKGNNPYVIRLLLKLGADRERVDYLGRNAIDYAFKYGAASALIELIGYEEEFCDEAC